MLEGFSSLWNVSEMNRDSLLNKTLSPPLSSRVPISHSNGISYSNSSLSGGQMNEPSWIPSIRGSTHSVFILKFLFDAFCNVCVRASSAWSRVLAFALALAGNFRSWKLFPHSKKFKLIIFLSCYSCLSRQDLTTWYVINKINTTWSNSFPLVNITLGCSNIVSAFLFVDSSKCVWWVWRLSLTHCLAARTDAEISLDEAEQTVWIYELAQLSLHARAWYEHVWCPRYSGSNLGFAPTNSKWVSVW